LERSPAYLLGLATYLTLLMEGLLMATPLFGQAIKPNPAEPGK